MDLPDDTIKKFKCSGCEYYLSQGPVFLQHDGAAVCDRCHAPEFPATRNKQYETAARFLPFPCKNRDLGCRRTVRYTTQLGPNTHEKVCEYMQYMCPVSSSPNCGWVGLHGDILQHCQAQHPDRVLDSPCTLMHDISRPSVNTYLLCALQVLFLLDTKVCGATGKLYHIVRLLGASDKATDYSYTLDIRRGDDLLSKKGHVAEQDYLVIHKSTFPALDTNSLLSVLGGLHEATFTLTVKGPLREVCTRCGVRLMALLYRDAEGWWCERCAPATSPCRNEEYGCQHRDFDTKRWKHELYFCKQGIRCSVCRTYMSRGTLLKHYSSEHSDITYKTDSSWRATQTLIYEMRYSLVSGAAGIAVCWYRLCGIEFEFLVFIPVLSARLSEFRCVVRVSDPATGLSSTFTPEICYNEGCDWHISVQIQIPAFSGELDICLDINKTES